jgi:hypothetical protein
VGKNIKKISNMEVKSKKTEKNGLRVISAGFTGRNRVLREDEKGKEKK